MQIHNPAVATRLETDEAGKLSGVAVSHPDGSDETVIIPASRVLLSAGCWTPHVFHDLFKNRYYIDIPIESLGGHSLVVKAPPQKVMTTTCHSVYTTMDGLSPEVYSRPDGVIYVAGVNHASIPLPKPRVKAVTFDESVQKLKDIARRLIATPEGGQQEEDLEIVREGLCFRPITKRGTPYIARLPEDKLGEDFTTARGDGGGGAAAEGGSGSGLGGGGGGVFIAAGHGPWGISLSLGTGKVMAEMMSGKPLSADISSLGF